MSSVRSRGSNGRKSQRPEQGVAERSDGRSIWTGTIGFGLVQIPVRLVVAERHDDLTFHQLDKRDLARIRYHRVNEHTGQEVAWDDIVKGYELDDGRVVVVEDEDFEKANVKATHSIDIEDFVPRESIPPSYFDRPYVLVPDRGGARAYGLLRDAMAKRGCAAVGLVVIRTRQHLAAVLADGPLLVLELLRFEEDLEPLRERVADAPSEAKGAKRGSKKEVELAEQLVESLFTGWDPSKYRDTYRRDLLEAICKKAKLGKLPAVRAPREVRPQVTDLAALLKRSMAKAKHAAHEKHAPKEGAPAPHASKTTKKVA